MVIFQVAEVAGDGLRIDVAHLFLELGEPQGTLVGGAR